MAFTSADIDAVDRAIASGALEVRFADGRSVKYRSMDELLRARAIMQGETATDPLNQPGGVTYAVFTRD